ncbi:MAG: KH domain-containing protein [Thermoanaerobaculia bacterium]|nr:KH domain-containing protein [Thermoanaerobaculia bacterium]
MATPAEDLVAVVRLLVDDPRAVSAEAVVTEQGEVELRLRAAAADCGKVIGRHGRTIDALRTLARSRGAREGRPHVVELLED